jgi:hypothetical protein
LTGVFGGAGSKKEVIFQQVGLKTGSAANGRRPADGPAIVDLLLFFFFLWTNAKR